MTTSDHAEPIVRLRNAINSHDLDTIVGCFAETYRNETPAHPIRSFTGSEQVRRNWTQILAGIPDLHAEIVRTARRDDDLWAEWSWNGTRGDGAAFAMRGVTILGVDGTGAIAWTQFYMEPVDQGGPDAGAAVAVAVGAGS
jgi:hypothetical protein